MRSLAEYLHPISSHMLQCSPILHNPARWNLKTTFWKTEELVDVVDWLEHLKQLRIYIYSFITYSTTSSFVLFVNKSPLWPFKCYNWKRVDCVESTKYSVYQWKLNYHIYRDVLFLYLTDLEKILFIFWLLVFSKSNHHDFIFTKEKSKIETETYIF